MTAHDLPPWQTVYYHFRKWRKDGVWETLNGQLRKDLREAEGRERTPSAAIIDSQTVKMGAIKGERGYDGGKRMVGRKRHTLVDTPGLIMMVIVSTADIQDRDGAKQVFEAISIRFPRLKLIWADGGYRGKLIDWVKTHFNWLLEIIKRNDDVSGFKVLPRRWVVERTFSWLVKYRHLNRDYEILTDTSYKYQNTAYCQRYQN